MKKLVLFVMAVMLAALTNAENVTKEAALKKASLLKPGKNFVPAVEGKEKGYYIFKPALQAHKYPKLKDVAKMDVSKYKTRLLPSDLAKKCKNRFFSP